MLPSKEDINNKVMSMMLLNILKFEKYTKSESIESDVASEALHNF